MYLKMGTSVGTASRSRSDLRVGSGMGAWVATRLVVDRHSLRGIDTLFTTLLLVHDARTCMYKISQHMVD